MVEPSTQGVKTAEILDKTSSCSKDYYEIICSKCSDNINLSIQFGVLKLQVKWKSKNFDICSWKMFNLLVRPLNKGFGPTANVA